MTHLSAPRRTVPARPAGLDDRWISEKIARSVLTPDSPLMPMRDFHGWLAEFGNRSSTHVTRIPLNDLDGWHIDPLTGNIGHDSGKFFTVEGVAAHVPGHAVPRWTQPIIIQAEIGILGILVKEFDGVLHCLMQAKVEPGNANGLQISPTVQATRSNYEGVHRGRGVPYLEYFRDPSRHLLITDVRQSEQGSWFLRKHNRNMVVAVTDDVELLDGFCWLTLGQLHRLLALENVVNMDARTVLSCLPFDGAHLLQTMRPGGDPFRLALARSCASAHGSVHSTGELLRWITDYRSNADVTVSRIPLNRVERWHRGEYSIAHDTGRFFEVIAVDIQASGREVRRWSQPMIEPSENGIVALLTRRIDGVLHVLLHLRPEPGCRDTAELAPTVDVAPTNYDALPGQARPPFLDAVLSAPPERIRYDVTLSEEGGRFHHAASRYLIVEADEAGTAAETEAEHPGFRWIAVHQLVDLLRHSHYVNIQARSLVACLHSLSAPPAA
ncbi:NDP-hexose 2,3-dehydratase family protein [Actinomadura rudentiformis]|uniref:NDP-hexose 2,3-dehydratase n=1 Tax=Actinomadura rudentiformis TaxID=359158 RepID=A0A6H9YWQ5_9ACTN|nr:NDP-hexose 2,3-dehydratase family protein [Actinomadura rudentiformis]KAB2346159.1 NDP-hexose 2,3-dehydratase [Actinomadura rudentiformis]